MYIKHCPETCQHRRETLEKHLVERNVKNQIWVTNFSKRDPYVIWIHNKLDVKTNVAFTSGLVKTLEALRNFVRTNEKSAFFADDDLVMIKNWESFPIPELPYVNMSVGVNFMMLPDGKPRVIGNNGGCELVYMTREFAQYILDNVDTRQTSDIVIHGLVRHAGFPLVCVPVAQQTSLLEPTKSSLGESGISNWVQFVDQFKPTGIKYEDLRNESGFFARDNA
jgi:hypothetical protein